MENKESKKMCQVLSAPCYLQHVMFLQYILPLTAGETSNKINMKEAFYEWKNL